MICKMLHKYSNPKHKLFFSRLLMEVYAHNKTIYFLAHKWSVLVSFWMAWCRINRCVEGAQNQAVAGFARQCRCFHYTEQQWTMFSDDNGSQRVHCTYWSKVTTLKKTKINAFHNLSLLQDTGLRDTFQLNPGCLFPNEVNKSHQGKSHC